MGGIRINYIIPFFGEYTVNELTPQLIEQYLESRWGRDSEGNLQAMEATWVEEKNTLRNLVLAVDENYNFHKRLIAGLKYISLRKGLLPPLTKEQIDLTWEHAQKIRGGADFKRAFWIMVWAGMEAKDICDLRPKHFVQLKGQEWLIKDRHKTMLKKKPIQIKIPVLPDFKKILSEVPTPIDKNTPYFPNMGNDSLNRAIRKYFTRAGLKGYGSKYLRRHLGELALDMGQSETWVQQALGHALDSDVTKRLRVQGRDDACCF